jgi:hypothetical protein
MIKDFFAKIFSFFKKEKKTTYAREPIIPNHRKEKLIVEKRKDEINELKKVHVEKKEEKLIMQTLSESIPDTKLIDLEIEGDNIALFKVDGIYSIGPTSMLTGFVENGRIKKGMKTIVNEVNIKVVGIRKDMEEIASLLSGQEGTLEIKSKKNPLLKQGDYLEFE